MPQILKSLPESKLLIVGIGKDLARLQKLTKRLNLQEQVIFVGRVPYSQLPDYFRLGDLFVMPSRSRLFGSVVEGLGIVYLEASACGLPVIAGDSGGAPDAVINEVTGLVVNGQDSAAIARAAIDILSSPEKAAAMGAAGAEWVAREWSWQRWGGRFAELLTGQI
jgi:phosphatidylinositol alpha-1,6-mannosyltransferase